MTKSNRNEFVEKAKKVWGNKYDYSLVEYISAINKVKIIYDGWIFYQSPDNHLRGKICEKRWDTDRFIFDSKKIHGDKYDYSLVEFKGMKIPVNLLLNGIIYKQTPSKHLMGREIDKWRKLKTKEEFINDAKKVWGNKYDYSLVEYKGSFDFIKIIFSDKVYRQRPAQHLMGMNCERNTIKNEEDFFIKAKEKHGNKYDYSITKYNGIDKKIKFLYNDKIYEQKAGAHLYAGLVEKRKNKKTTKIFINEAEIVHDFKYDYSKVNYNNYQTKVAIICPNHGEWEQSAGSHLQGHGCPVCAESSGEKEISKILNKFKINFNREHRFKNCRGILHALPFDFYIPSMGACIEFDGIQHFQPIPYFGGIEAYEILKINDKIKTDYCEENYINLIRIRYDEQNIEKILWENFKVLIKNK